MWVLINKSSEPSLKTCINIYYVEKKQKIKILSSFFLKKKFLFFAVSNLDFQATKIAQNPFFKKTTYNPTSISYKVFQKKINKLVLNLFRYTMASASADNIKQWKFPDGNFIQNLSGHNAILNCLAINSDGVLVSGGKLCWWHISFDFFRFFFCCIMVI